MTLALVWAQARDGVIGLDGDMPWHLPEDLAHFKQLTSGHPVIMGRRTWESIPLRFRPLSERRNIVVTRTPGFVAEGAEVASSVDEAAALVPDELAWGIGGGSLYRELLPRAARLEVTEIDLAVQGDTHAPVIGPDWTRVAETPWQQSRAGVTYRFVSYARS